MHATLQQLRLFEAVARLESVTRAAEEAHLTQPAVSIQVKRLEEHVGMPLFDQVGRKLYLTAAGRTLLEKSRNILGQMAELDDALETLRGEVAGPVRVSAVTTAQYFLPHLLGAFVRRYPKVLPSMTVTNRERMISRLESYQDDLYVMGQVPDNIDVESVPFLENELVVVAHPDHPIAGRGTISLDDLTAERMLVREPGSGTRQAVERLFAANEVSVTPFMELGGGEALKQGVMAGLGVAIMSRHGIGLELALDRLAIVDCEAFPLHRPWYAVHPVKRQLPLAARTFLEFLESDGEQVVAGISGSGETEAA